MMSEKTRSRDANFAAHEGDAYAGREAEESLLVFTVAGVALAVRARQVDAISSVTPPTPVPGAPPHVLGLAASGERVIPLVDLGLFLDLTEPDGGEVDPMFRRTLYVRSGDLEAGLVCHRASGLIPLRTSALGEPNILQGARLKPFLAAELEGSSGVIGLLDLTALLEAAAVS